MAHGPFPGGFGKYAGLCVFGSDHRAELPRPEVEVVGYEVIVVGVLSHAHLSALFQPGLQHPPTERAPMPLSMHHTPFCLTFASFQDTSIPVILDPSRREQ